jgi:hypothetical protein
MKKVYLLVSSLFISSALLAQEVKNVGIGTAAPDKSAVLDIQSSDKGLLIPRLTQEQINTIANPATGLLVFKNEASNSGFFYFNGEKWSPLTNGDANAIATMDVNGWSLSGNASAVSGVKAAATAASFIGTPTGVPINFKIGNSRAGTITTTTSLYLGFEAGSGSVNNNNTAIGAHSLKVLTSGYSNTAIGAYTLNSATTGQLNLAIGGDALKALTIGYGNVGIGFGSLLKSTNGNNNIAIGTDVMNSSLSGSNNTAIGRFSLLNNVSGNNNVVLGYNSGRSNLGSGNVFLGNHSGFSEVGSNTLYIANTNTITPLIYGDFSAKFVSIGDVPVAKRNTVASSGAYSLIVEKGILSEKLKVALKSTADWADYVFEEEYKENMMTLEEVEAFTLKNKHLPNVPSATDLVKKGLDFNETSRMFMEKIEELTLYMIELNKEVKALKAENLALKSKLQDK